jgi:hypothetical protein
MRTIFGPPAVCAVAAALAAGMLMTAPAEAAKWRGKTRQGRGVSVHTDASGVANYARIRFIAPCKNRMAVFSTIWFTTPMDSTSTTSFTDGGPWQVRIDKHTRFRARGTISGGLRRSGRWTGTFKVRLRVYVDGRLDTTCRIKRLGWKASPV